MIQLNCLNDSKKDYLTGCYVRKDLDASLAELEQLYQNSQLRFSILLIDVDHFKTYNDKYGHEFGDEVLKHFSQLLRVNLDERENFLYRFGGDEFVVVFPEKTPEQAYRLATRFEDNLQLQPFLHKGSPMRISYSGGIASCPEDARTKEEIFRKADAAMYFSKKMGRARVTEYRHVRREKITWISAIAAVVLLAAMTVYFAFGNLFAEKVDDAQGALEEAHQGVLDYILPKSKKSLRIVYLKDGRTLQGIIEKESEERLVVRMRDTDGRVVSRPVQKTDVLLVSEAHS